MTTAQHAAEAFIALCNDRGDFVSNLKLQKLLYYAQGWHLARHDAPLFDAAVEAWERGPVVPEVYRAYQRFGWKPIVLDDQPRVEPELAEFVEEVWAGYGQFSAYQLEEMTRNELPWKRAWGEGTGGHRPIRPEDLAEFFRAEESLNARKELCGGPR